MYSSFLKIKIENFYRMNKKAVNAFLIGRAAYEKSRPVGRLKLMVAMGKLLDKLPRTVRLAVCPGIDCLKFAVGHTCLECDVTFDTAIVILARGFWDGLIAGSGVRVGPGRRIP